ncbi:MAG: hypothetical protein KIB51_02005 [Dysgonomonas mossii]|nr:hypothetical protein [Dysgonomonas mossii]
MELKNIYSKSLLLIIFFSMSLFSIAQTKENDKNLLLGEWVWEEASIADGKQLISFDFYNDYYKFYAEIEVKENVVFLKNSDERTQEVKYEVDGNYLGFDLPSRESYIAEWTILDDKLYMEFSISSPDNTLKKVNLLIIYKRK